MRFGLHQRKAINDLIVKSNGLFSVMFLFISSVACDAIDCSYLHSFIWIPQQHSLGSSLVSGPFPGARILKGLPWSRLLWRLPLCWSEPTQFSKALFSARMHLFLFRYCGYKDKWDWRGRNSQHFTVEFFSPSWTHRRLYCSVPCRRWGYEISYSREMWIPIVN